MAGATWGWNQVILAVVTWMLCSGSRGSLAQIDCATVLPDLAPCVNFVTNVSPSPPQECCNGVSSVVTTAKECLCEVAAPGGPGDEIPNLNLTRVEQIPALCGIDFSPASCQAAVAPPPMTPGTSASAQLMDIVSKVVVFLSSSTVAVLLALHLQ